MKPPRTKQICCAIAALATLPAGAVNLSTDGSGQVLLYPYYTTRNGFVTSLTVVNSNPFHTKVAKVRFREGRNSAPVLEFNLWLSPRDLWTATVVDNGTGAGVYSNDNSCTVPALGRTAAAAQPFVNAYYTGLAAGTFNDNGGNGLDRTREGYIEVIEMAVAASGADAASSPSTALGIALATAVKHASTGIPNNCPVVNVTTPFAAPDLLSPAGGLNGDYIIIQATTGTEFAHTPVALQRFFRPTAPGTSLYSPPGSLLPDLSSVSPARSDIFTGDTGNDAVITVPDWVAAGGQPIDAVSAVLMRSVIANEYDVSANFKTDFVITAPTKRFYVSAGSAAAAASPPQAAVGPFANTFASATAGGAQACDPVFFQAYDREEAPFNERGGSSPPPIRPPKLPLDICWGATVMTVVPGTPGASLQTAALFGSANAAALALPGSGSSSNYASGWIALWPTRVQAAPVPNSAGQVVIEGGSLPGGAYFYDIAITNDASGGLHNLVAAGNRYRGLPVIGFAATQALIGGQGYGGIFGHKYLANVAP